MQRFEDSQGPGYLSSHRREAFQETELISLAETSAFGVLMDGAERGKWQGQSLRERVRRSSSARARGWPAPGVGSASAVAGRAARGQG